MTTSEAVRVAAADPITAALAAAWHHEGCALRNLGSRQCRFWPVHLLSAARVRRAIESAGVVVATADGERVADVLHELFCVVRIVERQVEGAASWDDDDHGTHEPHHEFYRERARSLIESLT